jgi:hypothetical protein
VADLVRAASLLVSEAALQSLVARAAGSPSGGDNAESAGADSVGDSAGAESPGSREEEEAG